MKCPGCGGELRYDIKSRQMLCDSCGRSEDPYRFEKQVTDFDCYVFGEGKHHRIFDKLGAHMKTIDGVEGTHFAVWAPDARSVSVVGEFNMWDQRLHHMELHGESGIFELFVPGAWKAPCTNTRS